MDTGYAAGQTSPRGAREMQQRKKQRKSGERTRPAEDYAKTAVLDPDDVLANLDPDATVVLDDDDLDVESGSRRRE
jgi:hypothetical protein